MRRMEKNPACPYKNKQVCEELLKILEETMSPRNKKLMKPKEILALVGKDFSIKQRKMKKVKTASLVENFFTNNPVLKKHKKQIIQNGSFLSSLEKIFKDHPDRDFILKHAERYEKKFLQDEKKSLELYELAKQGFSDETAIFMLKGALKNSRLGGEATLIILEDLGEMIERMLHNGTWQELFAPIKESG